MWLPMAYFENTYDTVQNPSWDKDTHRWFRRLPLEKPFNVRLNETESTLYLMMLLIFMASFLRTCSWCIVKSATRRLEEKHRVDNQYCICLLLLLQFLSIPLHHYSLQDWCHVHAGDGTWGEEIWAVVSWTWEEEK